MRLSVFAPLALLFMVFAFFAAPVAAADVTITDAYAFATPETARNGAAFMTIQYNVDVTDEDIVPDRILGAESAIAETVELHTMQIENDVMQMRKIQSFPLPPTGNFKLTPQGVHVMFLGLNSPLVEGEEFPLVMIFEKAGRVDAMVTIRAAGDMPDHGDHDHMHDHGDDHDHDHGHGHGHGHGESH